MLGEAVSSALGRGDSVEEERTAGVVICTCMGGGISATGVLPFGPRRKGGISVQSDQLGGGGKVGGRWGRGAEKRAPGNTRGAYQ